MRRNFPLITGLALSLASGAGAGVGVAAGPLLQETFGARTRAMGQAHVALADDVFGMAFNPAGLSQLRRAQAVVQYGPDVLDHTLGFIGFGVPLTPSQAAGLSYSQFDAGEIELFDVNGNPTRTVSAQSDQLLHIGYAFASKSLPLGLPGILHVGAAGKYMRSVLAEEMIGSALAFDLGLLYRRQFSGGSTASIGAALANSGQGVRYSGGRSSGGARDPLPRTSRVGLSMEQSVLRYDYVSLAFELKEVAVEDVFETAFGMEYLHRGLLALRMGYRAGVDAGAMSTGLGLRRGSIEFDYAVSLLGGLGNLHKVSLSYAFDIPWVNSRSATSGRDNAFSLFILTRGIEKATSEGRLFDAMDDTQNMLQLFRGDRVAIALKREIVQAVEKLKRGDGGAVRQPYAMAHVYYYSREWAKASEWLQQAVEREPENTEVRKFLLMARKRNQETREFINLKRDARIAHLYELAHRAMEESELEKAEKILDEILSLTSYEPAVQLRGKVLEAKAAPLRMEPAQPLPGIPGSIEPPVEISPTGSNPPSPLSSTTDSAVSPSSREFDPPPSTGAVIPSTGTARAPEPVPGTIVAQPQPMDGRSADAQSVADKKAQALVLFFAAIRDYSRGQLPRSIATLKKARELDPSSRDIQSTLSRAEQELSDSHE